MSIRTRRVIAVTAAAMASILLGAASARADGPPQIRIGVLSQSEGTAHASAKASITARQSRPAEPAHTSAIDLSVHAPAAHPSTMASDSAPSYPTLPATSPLAKNPTPFGPGTFWYPGGPGVSCAYAAGTSPLCYRITGPASTATGVDPAPVAASIAARLDLRPGTIETSPSSQGLTGAPSWFWLEPAPTSQQATITLAGESVAVVATPVVDLAFGDGATLPNAGAGTPYRSGSPPANAVTHTYQTRCLPGDQGRGANVLPSCQSNGYRVIATVTWRFSYGASGPITQAGTVPARTTEADRSYPVSEARAFLVEGTQ
jgi:hypothetical protein